MLAYSEACDRNKDPILNILKEIFSDIDEVLEIGSGTGQHAVYFGQNLPHVTWQTSDLPENHAGIQAWLDKNISTNVKAPLALDANQRPWPVDATGAIFTANTLHIMSWNSVENLFQGIGETLKWGGILCVYGPFRYNGSYTSESNAYFDKTLKLRDPLSGIRDFEAVNELALQQGLSFAKDYPMPANNQTIVWQR